MLLSTFESMEKTYKIFSIFWFLKKEKMKKLFLLNLF